MLNAQFPASGFVCSPYAQLVRFASMQNKQWFFNRAAGLIVFSDRNALDMKLIASCHILQTELWRIDYPPRIP